MRTTDMSITMRQIEQAWPNPGPVVETRCLEVLASHDALDLAPMLGLEA